MSYDESVRTFASLFVLCFLVACTTSPAQPVFLPEGFEELSSLRVTIADASVRRAWSDARIPFTVDLRDFHPRFSAGTAPSPFTQVTLLQEPRLFGDFNHDGRHDVVAALRIGHGDDSVTDVIAVTIAASGALRHVSSMSLGHATVQRIVEEGGALRIEAHVQREGDPGPRNVSWRFKVPAFIDAPR